MSGVESVSAFLEMGGYGRFVWPAFALTAVVLVGLLGASLKALHDRQAELRALQSGDGIVHRRRRREVAGEA